MSLAQQDKRTQEVLAMLAPLAAEGVRQVIVIGKVQELRSFPAKDGREAVSLARTVVDEGTSMTIKFPLGQGPATGHVGAFLVTNVGEYQRQAQADGLAFV